MWDTMKFNNMCIRESHRHRRERKGQKKTLEELMPKNFTNLMKDINLQIQDAQQTPSKLKLKRSILTHIVKLLKNREMFLKAAREAPLDT